MTRREEILPQGLHYSSHEVIHTEHKSKLDKNAIVPNGHVEENHCLIPEEHPVNEFILQRW